MIKHEFIYSKFQLTHKVLFEIWEADRLNIEHIIWISYFRGKCPSADISLVAPSAYEN